MKLLDLLERGVIALEKLADISKGKRAPVRQRQTSELVNYGTYTWQRETLKSEIAKAGLSPEDSERALNEVMLRVQADEEANQ